MAKLDKDTVIAAFTNAYTKANGKAPEIEVKSGWYSVDGGKNIRLAQLQEMTDSLSDASSESVEAPAEKASKPAKVKAAKAVKKATPGFSVKGFWAEQLSAGSTLPR